jgi:hypothetical protein
VFKLLHRFGLSIVLSVCTLQITVGQAAEIKDPMQPPEYALKKFRQAKNKNNPAIVSTKNVKNPQTKPLKLTSILYSPTRKIAIIDDQMIGVGGTINGARVVRIDQRSARLVRKGKVINLRLPEDFSDMKKILLESKI